MRPAQWMWSAAALLFVMSSEYAQARCHEGYANHLIDRRYGNCANGKVTDGWQEDRKFAESCGKAVSIVCGNGCYDAMFNSSLVADCDKQYLEAIKPCESIFKSWSDAHKCQDSGKWSLEKDPAPQTGTGSASSGADSSVPATANRNCRWVSLNTTDLMCEGVRKVPLCGTDPKKARSICSGILSCTAGATYQDEKGRIQEVDPGLVSVSCLTDSGYCKMSIEECLADPRIAFLPKDPHAVSPRATLQTRSGGSSAGSIEN